MKREWVGYIIGVLGIILSWYFYEKSIQKKAPELIVDARPTAVFTWQAEKPAPLQVRRADGTPLTRDVFVATHIFWNSGNAAILAGDVLSPFKFSINDPTAEILSIVASRQSRRITGCNVDQIDSVSWKLAFNVLESDDGCEFVVHYSAAQRPRYEVAQDVIGARETRIRDLAIDGWKDENERRSSWVNLLPIPYILVISVVVAIRRRKLMEIVDRVMEKLVNDERLGFLKFLGLTGIVVALLTFSAYGLSYGFYSTFVANRTPNTSAWVPASSSAPQTTKDTK
jgi:hypothetical protein